MVWLGDGLRGGRRLRGILPASLGVAMLCGVAGCYDAGNGTAPPPDTFYFPVGLAVSSGGNVLYAINSDFDLQWNGGTLQSYDLHQIRRDTVLTIANPTNPAGNVPFVNPPPPPPYNCPSNPPQYMTNNSGQRQPIGQTCSPQVDSSFYVRDSATIGAFATDLQVSIGSFPSTSSSCGSAVQGATGTYTCQRLFAPVRGDTSLTWAAIVEDDPLVAPVEQPDGGSAPGYLPFTLNCGTRTGVENRCATDHQAGVNPNDPGDTRFITMPGEPFGMAQTDDGTAIVITHQTEPESSLFLTGINPPPDAGSISPEPLQTVFTPSIQFVVTGIDNGGNGIAAVPHDPDAFPQCPQSGSVGCPRPAFLQTSRDVAKVDLLRYYSDQDGENSSSLLRPFLDEEEAFGLTVNASGSDSRGIAIDSTPRIACKATISMNDPQYAAKIIECARLPARVFIANRAPESLILGQVGAASTNGDGTYDADQLVFTGNVPLLPGPSRVYLAPIVDSDGNYALRVFVVCFDSNTIVVYDPNANMVEAFINVGVGPFAMAFDPFTLQNVALHAPVPQDPREPDLDLKVYRFAYVASFTDSYVQIIDLDNSRTDKSTFEQIVYTLGTPTLPKGTQ